MMLLIHISIDMSSDQSLEIKWIGRRKFGEWTMVKTSRPSEASGFRMIIYYIAHFHSDCTTNDRCPRIFVPFAYIQAKEGKGEICLASDE
jgi:hypothetical protein